MNARWRKQVKFPLEFSFLTFCELKTRRGNFFFGLKSHSENGPNILSVVLTAPIIWPGYLWVKSAGGTQLNTGVQTFVAMPILRKFETEVNTFLFMYMNSRDVIICYLELRKTRSVFPIPLEFEISKFACSSNNCQLPIQLPFDLCPW